eukprot:3914076-Rhodomonas_salina.4
MLHRASTQRSVYSFSALSNPRLPCARSPGHPHPCAVCALRRASCDPLLQVRKGAMLAMHLTLCP